MFFRREIVKKVGDIRLVPKHNIVALKTNEPNILVAVM